MRNYGGSIVKEALGYFWLPVFDTFMLVDEDVNQTHLDIRTDKGDITVIVNCDDNGAHTVEVYTINGKLKEGNFTLEESEFSLVYTVITPQDYTQKIRNYREEHTYVPPEFVVRCICGIVDSINGVADDSNALV